jgi:hypothetical protein
MFLSGVQFRIRLDSRLKHAGMTVFGKKINLTQQAAGNMTRSDSKYFIDKMQSGNAY